MPFGSNTFLFIGGGGGGGHNWEGHSKQFNVFGGSGRK